MGDFAGLWREEFATFMQDICLSSLQILPTSRTNCDWTDLMSMKKKTRDEKTRLQCITSFQIILK